MKFQKDFTRTVLLTGLLAGGLDATAASIQYNIKTGMNPARVFRYIASGVFGKNALSENLYGMAAWGLFFHLVIAMIFTFLFFLFYPRIIMMLKNKYITGILYAIFVWTVMNLVVVPLTFGTGIAVKFPAALIAAGILIIAIGLPISLMANRYYSKKIVAN